MPTIIKTGVPCVGIASNEEARVVRASGFKGKLVRVRTATLPEINTALKYNMEELVGNADFARQASELAHRHGSTLKVHLALKSAGMSRNGLDMATEQGKQDAIAITEMYGLKVVSVMTHFPVEDKDEVKKGLVVFNQDVDWLFRRPPGIEVLIAAT